MRVATIISVALLITLSSGFKLKHVSTKHCIKDYDAGNVPSQYIVVDCSNPRFATAEFKWKNGQKSGEQQLSSQWVKWFQNKDKCVYVNNDDFPNEKEYYVGSQDCSDNRIQEYLPWTAIDAGNGAILIRHNKSGLCLKPEDNSSNGEPYLAAAGNCSASNQKMLWQKA